MVLRLNRTHSFAYSSMVVIQGCYTKTTNDNDITYYYNDDDNNNNCNNNSKEIKDKEATGVRAGYILCVTNRCC